MGTFVTIDVVGPIGAPAPSDARDAAIEQAFDWFRQVEACCSRFDPDSELRRLTRTVGEPVRVSEMLWRALEFACAIADETGGAFDPAIGGAMTARGFTRHYQTGAESPHDAATIGATFRDVHFDHTRRTVTLGRPLLLDLGAVAKGLAIDLAAHDLTPWGNFAIDAGGDLYFGGHTANGEPWRCGVRHPRRPETLAGTLLVSDRAVCTSGDYERRAPDGGPGHHLVDARTGRSADALISATVLADSAILADALATAAFVLGPSDAIALFARTGVEGMVMDEDLHVVSSPGWSDALLPHA